MTVANLSRNSEIIQNQNKLIKAKNARSQTSAFFSELRREIELKPNTNSYEVSVHQANAQSIGLTEKVLSDTDEFITTEVGFYLCRKYTPTTGANVGITRNDHILETFANPVFYPSFQQFDSLFQGKLKYAVENQEQISAFPLSLCQKKRVGKADNINKFHDEFDGEVDGLAELGMNVHTRGKQRTKWTLNFPNVGAATFANPNKTIGGVVHSCKVSVVLVLRGVLVSNAAYLHGVK